MNIKTAVIACVTRYVEDQDFQNLAFDGLADEILDSVLAGQS
jgi:hypothetical protein